MCFHLYATSISEVRHSTGASVMHIHQSHSAEELRSVNTTSTAQPTGIQLFKKGLAAEGIYHQKSPGLVNVLLSRYCIWILSRYSFLSCTNSAGHLLGRLFGREIKGLVNFSWYKYTSEVWPSLKLKWPGSLSRLNKRKHYQTSLSAVLDPFGKQPVSYSSNQRVFLRDLQAGQEASAGVISNC